MLARKKYAGEKEGCCAGRSPNRAFVPLCENYLHTKAQGHGLRVECWDGWFFRKISVDKKGGGVAIALIFPENKRSNSFSRNAYCTTCFYNRKAELETPYQAQPL
jgi:hypothetical protein